MLRRRAPFVLFVLLIGLLLGPRSALGHPYRLPSGREADVLALLAPYSLGGVIVEEQKLWTVSIEKTRIRIGARGPDGADAEAVLVHPEDEEAGLGKPISPSFVAIRGPSSPSGAHALDCLLEAVRKNDHGGLWSVPIAGENAPTRAGRLAAFAYGNWSQLDGIGLLLVFGAIAVVLSVRLLRAEARWMRFSLVGVVLLGACLRLWLSPVSFLGAWPWSRLWPNVRAVVEGPLLSWMSEALGHGFYLTDVIFWTNFSYAALMPLVLFVHASYLLRDCRAGLLAAFAIAILPQHIRFSRCEDAFIPSLLLTSLSFALMHGFLRDTSRFWRGVCVALLPIPLFTGYLLRPLNMLFVAVYAVAVLFLHAETATRARRGAALALIVGIWLVALPIFIRTNRDGVSSAASDLWWMTGAFRVLFTPKLLVLTDPVATPPVLVVLAVLGGVWAYREGEKRLVLFLCGWIGLFLVAHAFVVVPAMMPRYHLHLVVPFLLLASMGLLRAFRKSRLGFAVALSVLLVSPVLHRRWISDLRYNEMVEYEFVRKYRDIVPDGCTVLEYAGTDADAKEGRFARIGARVGAKEKPRFAVVPVFANGVKPPEGMASLDEVLKNPPACLYVYEGLSCYGDKNASDPSEPGCYAMERPFETEVVERIDVSPELYDANNIRDPAVLRHHFQFSLLRVKGRKEGR